MKNLVLSILGKSTKEETTNRQIVSENRVCDYDTLDRLYDIDTSIKRLEDIVGLPSNHYEALYVNPIRLMSLRLQHTPFPKHHSKSLLKFKLNAIIKGMKHRESFIMPAGVAPEDINHKKDLWRFATFYSLLIYNIGPWITCYRTYYKSSSNSFDILNPFGQMPEAGTELKYQASHSGLPESSLLIAPLIFPPSAIGWLLRDAVAFNSAITNATKPFRQDLVGKVVQYAYDLSPEESSNNLEPLPTTQETQIVATEEIQPIVVPEKASTENLRTEPTPPTLSAKDHGRSFLNYLHEYLPAAIKLNSPDLLTTDKETFGFKSPEIFQNYAKANGLDWKTVKNGFKKLSIHLVENKDGHSNYLHSIPGTNGESQWLVIPRSVFNITGNFENIDGESIFKFLDWLKIKLDKKELPNSKERPLCFPVKENWCLVSPDIFELYSTENSGSSHATRLEEEFLSRNLHQKNEDSDFFKFSLGNKNIKVIKISEQSLWQPLVY